MSRNTKRNLQEAAALPEAVVTAGNASSNGDGHKKRPKVPERIDDADMPLLKLTIEKIESAAVLVKQAQTASQEAEQLQQTALRARAEAMGADQLFTTFVRDKYGIEGQFTVDKDGQFNLIPSAEIVAP